MQRRIIGLFLITSISCSSPHEVDPIQQHPDNPHYLIFRGQPTALITLAEHYAAVINLDFNYISYLDELQNRGFNLTRLFAYWRNNNDAHLAKNGANSHLGPKGENQYCAPWAWSKETGGFDGRKFDLNQWNSSYFTRLKDFITQAGHRGVIVEVVLFCRPYDADAWKVDAFNSLNNTTGDTSLSHHFISQTLENNPLLKRQKEYVTKIVQELSNYDNIYFEICNEPAVQSQMIEAGLSHAELWRWHQEMINTIKDAEHNLPSSQKHMIAINPMHGHRIEWDDYINFDDIHIINRHYNNALENIWRGNKSDNADYFRNKVCSLDEGAYIDVPHEGHTHHTIPEQQIVEGWRYMASGGGIYDGLAKYMYLLSNPSGDTPNGNRLKSYFQILISYFNKLDFINMTRDKNVVVSGLPNNADWRAISDPGKQYLIYIAHGHNKGYGLYVLDSGDYQIDLKLNLHNSANGSYIAEWINTINGDIVKTEEFDHTSNGYKTIRSPEYDTDIALIITSR
ncbi:cellulase family glycosylhydrolase [Bacteroidota bacterium]